MGKTYKEMTVKKKNMQQKISNKRVNKYTRTHEFVMSNQNTNHSNIKP